MCSRSNKIISSDVDLSNYVEGYDLFNSVLIDQLSDTSLEKETYVVTTKEYRTARPDSRGDLWLFFLHWAPHVGRWSSVRGL